MPIRKALLIGVPKYRIKAIPPLSFIKADLEKLQKALDASGYQVQPIIGIGKYPATPGEIRGGIHEFCSKAKKDETLLLWFSGHGVHFQGDSYLVPYDARIDDPDLRPYLISAEDFKKEFENSKAETILFFIDACREGIELGTMGSAPFKAWDPKKFRLSKEREVAFIYSCSAGQVSSFIRKDLKEERKNKSSEGFSLFSRAVSETISKSSAATFREATDQIQNKLNEFADIYKKPRQTIDPRYGKRLLDRVIFEKSSQPTIWSMAASEQMQFEKTRKEVLYGRENNFIELPDRIAGLSELAFNMWWTWHPEANSLFNIFAHDRPELTTYNPVKLLQELKKPVLHAAAKNVSFLTQYDSVRERFKNEMGSSNSWFYSVIDDSGILPIAFFSAEYGLHHSLPFYASGRGFMAGDFLKECSDLGVPAVGVGFMYPQGYLRQMISPEGWQVGACEILDWENAPIRKVIDAEGNPLSVKLSILDPPIYLEVWKVQVGKIALYLIDTSTEANDPWNRCISDRLYSGDSEQRLRQEIVLGIGGVRVLKALGIDFSILHLNESHPAFAVLERIREFQYEGMTYKDAFDYARNTTVFTTHTSMTSAHDVFTFMLMDKYFGAYLASLELPRDDFFRLGINPSQPDGFNMTAFAMRCSAYRNAVSKKHGEVTRKMWHQLWPELPEDQVPIDYITNGVHVPSWIDRRLSKEVLDRYLPMNWLEEHDNPKIWENVNKISDKELWERHLISKRIMIDFFLEKTREESLGRGIDTSGVMLNSNALTIGFARRFASNKRHVLILQDIERLKKILNNRWEPVQIIFAGKAHQEDDPSKKLLQKVFNTAIDPAFAGRIAFIEDYDWEVAQYLVHGVDVWLNNPILSTEACGTSGMKASINGVVQLSIMDGWWVEGYNGNNGWAFQGAEGQDRDAKDAAEIYNIIEKNLIPAYYDIDDEGVPHRWVKIMKESIKFNTPRFSSKRMVKEYVLKFYQKILKNRKPIATAT
jgi:glycogen phosphorylase